ncbi:flavin reductase family protein [Subtercola lobariae]|uniref:Flavin reductase n=1 Tax=Subtercola lobariae TaxID=1588641 RepID=A0A917BBS7_9MICO|nr:flavin reductase family protein [Subtercola lobariae]GGF30791.1 flavin reductase [Subtercola lobariae]
MSNDIDPALFRETLGHYPTGVAVVTAVPADGNPTGMVVGTFSSVSLDPPLIAFFPTASSKTWAQLRTADSFCINVLASDQEALCRQLARSGPSKFDGVNWRPGPLGSPILEDAVSWIECTFEDIRETGDHYIVLGRVHDLAVQRSTLPLLFFQGGYGRFSPRSLIAAPDPELIQAAQIAETIRSQVERVSSEFGVNCGVLAKVGWDSVQVLISNQGRHPDPYALGHRQPLIPPFGAVFMADADESVVDEWLGRTPDDSESRRQLNEAFLSKVQGLGYSYLAAKPEVIEAHEAVLTEFEASDRLPRQERVVKQATLELADNFCPDLVAGERYDLANVVVPLPTGPGAPAMALRLTGLPPHTSTEQIEAWVQSLQQIAALARQ